MHAEVRALLQNVFSHPTRTARTAERLSLVCGHRLALVARHCTSRWTVGFAPFRPILSRLVLFRPARPATGRTSKARPPQWLHQAVFVICMRASDFIASVSRIIPGRSLLFSLAPLPYHPVLQTHLLTRSASSSGPFSPRHLDHTFRINCHLKSGLMLASPSCPLGVFLLCRPPQASKWRPIQTGAALCSALAQVAFAIEAKHPRTARSLEAVFLLLLARLRLHRPR